MDFYTNLTFKVQKGRGLGSRDPISKFWDPPYNFWTNRAIRFKFGRDKEDGPLLRPDHKTTPNWTWTRSRDQISKFWDPPNNFKTNRDICFKFGTDIDDGPLLLTDSFRIHSTHTSYSSYVNHVSCNHRCRICRIADVTKWAWRRSRDPISKFRDPLITFERIKQSASNLAQT